MKTSLQFIGLTLALMTGMASASGFKCEGLDSGFRTKLFNHVQPGLGTRVPAAMIVSHEDEGTLLSAKGADIRKRNRANTVQYVTDGNDRLDADTVILQIRFKEGREVIERGETAPGQLVLVKDGTREVYDLSCERYLKRP